MQIRFVNMQIFESQFNKSVLFARAARGQMITWTIQILTTVNLGTIVIDILFGLLIIQMQHMIYRSAKILLHQRWLTPPSHVL